MNNGIRNTFKAVLILFIIAGIITAISELAKYVGQFWRPYAQ